VEAVVLVEVVVAEVAVVVSSVKKLMLAAL
jgi:hypothetical protein